LVAGWGVEPQSFLVMSQAS